MQYIKKLKVCYLFELTDLLMPEQNWPGSPGTDVVTIWSNTDESVQWRDEEEQNIVRKQALYHTVVQPNRGGAGLFDSVVYLKALQTSTHILSLKFKKDKWLILFTT